MFRFVLSVLFFFSVAAYAGTKENTVFCRETSTFLESEVLGRCKSPQTKKIVEALDSSKCEKYIVNFLEALKTISTVAPMSDEKCKAREITYYIPKEDLVRDFTYTYKKAIGGILDGGEVSNKFLQLNLSNFDEDVLLKLARSYKKDSVESKKALNALYQKELDKYRSNLNNPKYNSSLLKNLANELDIKVPVFQKIGYITYGNDCHGVGREDIYLESSEVKNLDDDKLCKKTLEVYALLKDRRVSEDDDGSSIKSNETPEFMSRDDAEKIKKILNDPELKKQVESLTTKNERKYFFENLDKLMPEIESMQGQVQPWDFIDKLWGACSGKFKFIQVGPPRDDCG